MDILETVRQWLMTFPLWGEAPLRIDCIGPAPENGALFPRGVELVKTTENVLGGRKQHLRCTFLLQRVEHAPDGENAAALLQLQQWVYEQCAAGKAPKIGEDTRWRAELGRLDGSKGPGTGVYTVNLTAEFVKNYE